MQTIQHFFQIIKNANIENHLVRWVSWQTSLRLLLKTDSPLAKIVLKLLAKSVLIPLRLTTSAADAVIQKKNFKSGNAAFVNSD